MIDTTFDFRSDSNGKDPDGYSPTLNKYHQVLWSKELPNGESMNLKSEGPPYTLHWKGFILSSDSIIVELKYEKNKRIIDQVCEIVDDPDARIVEYCKMIRV